MGLVVNENFVDKVFITQDSDGSAATGLSPTCTIIDESDNRSSGTVAEVANGWYKVTDFTPDAAGLWATEWAVSGAYTIHYPYKIFWVGKGQEDDILTALGSEFDSSPDLYDVLVTGGIPTWPAAAAPAGAVSIAQVVRAIYNDTNEIQITLAAGGTIESLIDDLETRLTAARAGYLDELDFDLDARLGSPAGASISADLLTIDNLVDGLETAVGSEFDGSPDLYDVLVTGGIPTSWPAAAAPAGGVSLAQAIRAIYDDTNEVQTTLAAGGTIESLIDDLESRLTAGRAGYLDELDFDLDARLGSPAGASISADLLTIDNLVDDLESRLTAARAGYLDQLDFNLQEHLDAKEYHRDYWSDAQSLVTITGSSSDVNLPNIQVPALPVGAIIAHVVLLFKCAKIKDSSGSDNAINGAAAIRIKKSTGAWGTDDIVAYDIQDNSWSIDVSEATEIGGDAFVGNENNDDLSGEVDAGGATYNLRLEDIAADGANLLLHDVAVGLRFYLY